MKTDTALSLSQAAKAAHKSKSSILEAIKTGRISARQDEAGRWEIEPVELFRVYPQNGSENGFENHNRTPKPNASEPVQNRSVAVLETELRTVLEERERERRQYDETIADLRKRLDIEGEERRKLTALLVHDKRESDNVNDKNLKETAEHFHHRRHSQRNNSHMKIALIVLLVLGAILLGVAVLPNVITEL